MQGEWKRPLATLTCPPPRRGDGAHHAFSIAVIAAGGRSPQPFDVLRVALSERYATSRESNGQQKPAESAGSRAKHSHSAASR